MAVVAQSREMDMRDVLKHSLGLLPWSLAAVDGSYAKTTKSKLAELIEKGIDALEGEPDAAVWILDAMIILQALTNIPPTFADLVDQVFSVVMHMGSNAVRTDFVADRHPKVSIKGLERLKRGLTGSLTVRLESGAQRCPRQWKKFLSSGENKALISFFVKEWQGQKYAKKLGAKQLFVTEGENCIKLSNVGGRIVVQDIQDLKSTQEEADTRMLLHASHACNEGFSSILIKSSDTDVKVLAVYFKERIQSRLFILSGTKNRSRCVDIGEISNNLGKELCAALPGLHAFTGCDTTSAFVGKGKKKGLDLLEKSETALAAMQKLGESFEVSDSLIKLCQDFVCALYGGQKDTVNELRYLLFCTKSMQDYQLPPTLDALRKHVSRANYQCAIWKRALLPQPSVPSPVGKGWKITEDGLSVDWMYLLPAPLAVLELLSCRCNSSCSNNRCSCFANKLLCTDACYCGDSCENRVIEDFIGGGSDSEDD